MIISKSIRKERSCWRNQRLKSLKLFKKSSILFNDYNCATKSNNFQKLIYSLTCIFIALLTSVIVLINGADCLTSSVLNANSSINNGRVFIVKTPQQQQQQLQQTAILRNNNNNNQINIDNKYRNVIKNLQLLVKENTPIGSQIAPIQLDSIDQELHNTNTKANLMQYAIIGGQDQQSFTLKSDDLINNKVELINEVLFDYESEKKNYSIKIRGASIFVLYEWNIEILVTDENDNKPQLDDFSIVFNNYKNHFPLTPIGRVPATDLDVNDQLTYRILSGNNAQLILINETNGDIQLSPWLNSNVPMKAFLTIAVSDGINDAIAQLTLTINLVTEQMLQNSVQLKLEMPIGFNNNNNNILQQETFNLNREEFLNKKYDKFLQTMARIIASSGNSFDSSTTTTLTTINTNSQYKSYGTSNIILFDVEEVNNNNNNLDNNNFIYRNGNTQLYQQQQQQQQQVNNQTTTSVIISFSARSFDSQDVDSYLSSSFLEEKIYLNRLHLMNELELNISPFQDNLCLYEPCKNYQECQAIYKFDKAPKTFLTTKNMIFRPIKTTQSFACLCPKTYTGMKHKTECNLQINQCFPNPCLNNGICHINENGFTCECKSSEYFGLKCEHSFTNSTCQSITSYSNNNNNNGKLFDDYKATSTSATSHSGFMCSGKSRCVNTNSIRSQFLNNNNNNNNGRLSTIIGPTTSINNVIGTSSANGGFTCQGCSYPQWSNELCQLKSRSFTKNSYLTLPNLKRRHKFNIKLKFSTILTDALIFYNGRYNDKNDFIALEIIDSFLKFSFSLGGGGNVNGQNNLIYSVSLMSHPISDGNWHKVTIDYKDKNATLLIDDCDPILDEALAKYSPSSTMKRCSNTTTTTTNYYQYYSYNNNNNNNTNTNNFDFRMLDLTSPMYFGSLPPIPILQSSTSSYLTSPLQLLENQQQQLQSTNTRFLKANSFIGCLSDIYIDNQFVDLYNPIQEVGTQIGCPEKKSFCQPTSCNGNGQCQDIYGSAKCICGDYYLGKSCEFSISQEKVRKFHGNSYLTVIPIESTISPNSDWIVSMHFRTLNPNGLLMKISLDPEATIQLELLNGGLKLSHYYNNNNINRNLTFNKIMLDDGEWHFVEIIWGQVNVQLEIDYNSNLSIQSDEFSIINGGQSVFNSIIKMITIGASPIINKSSSINQNSDLAQQPQSDQQASPSNGIVDFTSSSAALNPTPQSQPPVAASSDDQYYISNSTNLSSTATNSINLEASSSISSFVGCIYGVNISDNTDLWLSLAEERNVERGCQPVDICEQANVCPPNSRCIRKGSNQRKCICNPGFVGDRCLPVCDLNPCQGENSKCIPNISNEQQLNNSIFATDLQAINQQSYRCECEPFRSGKNCEHQLKAGCPSNYWTESKQSIASTFNNNNNNNNNQSQLIQECKPCICDESKGFDGDCDKLTGKCYCKTNHYQPPGSDYCLPCDCYIIGSLATSCNQTSGQCKCRQGVVGRRCDTCTGLYAEVTLRGCEVIYTDCPKTFSDGIWWDKTKLDQLATQQCPPSTSTGTATRFCHKTEGWQKANMFDCISNSFRDLFTQYQFLEENNVPLTTILAMKIASNLRRALNETIQQATNNNINNNNYYYQDSSVITANAGTTTTTLYGSDMYISFRLIHHLIQHESRQFGLNLTHRQDNSYIKNIAESISYLLDPNYAENWPEIGARSPNGGAEYLLKLIDLYGKILIESQSDTFTQPFELQTKYFTFGLDLLSTEQLYDLTTNGKSPISGGGGGGGGNNSPSSPPYATDTTLYGNDHFNGIINDNYYSSPLYLDYSLTQKDSSPALIVPKNNDYQHELATTIENNNNINQDIPLITTKALIPLKTLKVKTIQELLPTNSYYQSASAAAKSAAGAKRAKRNELIIPTDYRIIKQHQQQQQPALVVYSIWKSLGPLLPNFYDSSVQHSSTLMTQSNSPVIWLTMRPANGSDFLNKNIQPKVTYMLKILETSGRNRPQCVSWNFINNPSNNINNNNNNNNNKNFGSSLTGSSSLLLSSTTTTTNQTQQQQLKPVYGLKKTGEYTTKGCEIKGIGNFGGNNNNRLRSIKYNYINCSCDHLGAVTILMDTAANYDYLSSLENYNGYLNGDDYNSKDLILIISLIISILILLINFFLLTFIRGHSIKSNSNTINKNLIFILILIELLILYNINSRNSLNQREYQCKLIAIFLQYFSISLFFWLLVNSIHFYRMLTELRDINHGPMKFYHIIGYAIPAFLVSIAVGLRIELFGNDLFCWLSLHESIIWSMFLPIIIVTLITISLLILAFKKSLPIINNSNNNNFNNNNNNDKFFNASGDAINNSSINNNNNNNNQNQLNNVDLLKNHMFINIMKTPLIAIYWLILVYSVNESLSLITFLNFDAYLLPIITILKSLILLILLCYIDKHIKYNLYVSWLRFRGKNIPFIIDNNNQNQNQNFDCYYTSSSLNYHNQQQHSWLTGLNSINQLASGEFLHDNRNLLNNNVKSYYNNSNFNNSYGAGATAGYHTTNALSPTTPGFQGSCTDIFRPEALAYSAAASTTSRSTATGTSSSAAYHQYHSNRVNSRELDHSGGYGRSNRNKSTNQHRSRRHKKSHHKHHHHKHHHHHHHHSHRSHKHERNHDSESNYDLDRHNNNNNHHHYGRNSRNSRSAYNNNHNNYRLEEEMSMSQQSNNNELASSHSSDDVESTMLKKTYNNNNDSKLRDDEQQTMPMELSTEAKNSVTTPSTVTDNLMPISNLNQPSMTANYDTNSSPIYRKQENQVKSNEQTDLVSQTIKESMDENQTTSEKKNSSDS